MDPAAPQQQPEDGRFQFRSAQTQPQGGTQEANATTDYKPYSNPEDVKKLEDARKFEDDSAWQTRKKAQQKKNKIIIVAVCITALFFIIATIGIIVIVALTYSTPASLNNVNASPDFDDLLWEVTGSIEIIDEPLRLSDISIRVAGSAVKDPGSKSLSESQWPVSTTGGSDVKHTPGSVIGFKISVPMKDTVKGPPTVLVTLSVDGAKVESTEIDVSRYYTDGKI